MVDNYLYILFGTNSHQYCTNVYKINLKSLESSKLFDSIELRDNVSNFTQLNELNQKYPNNFLDGRYRQEVIYYKNKLYAFGGGSITGEAYVLSEVLDYKLKFSCIKIFIFLFLKLPVFDLTTNDWEFILTEPDLKTKSI